MINSTSLWSVKLTKLKLMWFFIAAEMWRLRSCSAMMNGVGFEIADWTFFLFVAEIILSNSFFVVSLTFSLTTSIVTSDSDFKEYFAKVDLSFGFGFAAMEIT